MRTDKKIDGSNDIRWTMGGEIGWFTFLAGSVNSAKCNGGYTFKGTEGFLQQAGVLTFLKSATQLQVWFDDDLEVTWVFEDNSDSATCKMRLTLAGLRFVTPSNRGDKVSTHYRYELGKLTQSLVFKLY